MSISLKILYFLCLFTSTVVIAMEHILTKQQEEPTQVYFTESDTDSGESDTDSSDSNADSRRRKIFDRDPTIDTFFLMRQVQDYIELLDKKDSELNKAKFQIMQLQKQIKSLNFLLKKNQKLTEK